jgi:UDP-glucose 4-epimerase
MRVLVTGAAGFVGTALRRRLADAGHDIVAVARGPMPVATARTEWISVDLGQPGARLPGITGVDAVVYLAQSRDYRRFPERALDIFQVNAAALLMALDWSREHGVKRFVYTSSANVYRASRRALTEDAPLMPESFYGQTKLFGEALVRAYPGHTHLNCVVLRLFSVYGPGQTGMLVPDLIERTRTRMAIDVQGGSGLKLTPVFVSDVADCVERALHLTGAHGLDVLNVGGPQALSIREMGDAIGGALGIEPLFRALPGPEPPGYASDNTHLRERLGFEPSIRFDEGIQQTIHVSSETRGTTTRS